MSGGSIALRYSLQELVNKGGGNLRAELATDYAKYSTHKLSPPPEEFGDR